jgi:hypothetical protein
MPETCKTCKWWGPNFVPERKNARKVVELPQVGGCYSPARTNLDDLMDNPSGFVLEAEEGGADLLTGPDFGCIHHEDR